MSNEQEQTEKKRRSPRTADDKLADALATAQKDYNKAESKHRAAVEAERAAAEKLEAAQKVLDRYRAAAVVES